MIVWRFSMKIIVTGGAGFIGSHLVDRYIADGNDVFVIDNLSNSRTNHINPKAKLINLDIKKTKDIANLISDLDPHIINHHAADIYVNESFKFPAKTLKNNILGTINILEGARKLKRLKKIIFASSGGAIYNELRHGSFKENRESHPQSIYGISKYTCELLLKNYYKKFGINFTILRYSNVYGSRQEFQKQPGVVTKFIECAIASKKLVINGTGEQTRDFIFIDDVVRANIELSRKNINGVFNISSNKEVSIVELANKIKVLMNNKLDFHYRNTKDVGMSRSVLSYKKANDIFGWSPRIELDEGLKRTINYLRSKNL